MNRLTVAVADIISVNDALKYIVGKELTLKVKAHYLFDVWNQYILVHFISFLVNKNQHR